MQVWARWIEENNLQSLEKDFNDTVRNSDALPIGDPNEIWEDGKEVFSLLTYAIQLQRVEIVALLLANERVDVNINLKFKARESKNRWEYWTPLGFAVSAENVEIVKLLLKNEYVDANKTFGPFGRTPLIAAVQKKNTRLISCLLHCDKVDPNMRIERRDWEIAALGAIARRDKHCLTLLQVMHKREVLFLYDEILELVEGLPQGDECKQFVLSLLTTKKRI